MIGNFIFAGGLFWMTLLVTSAAGQNCTGKEPIIVPPVLVAKYGGPAKATCSVPYKADSMGWEATVGNKQQDDTMQLDWSVDNVTDWSLNVGIKCYANADVQCWTRLPITIYKLPKNVSLLLSHTGPLLEGQQYSLQCEVQSVAPAQNLTIIWYRGDTELQRTDFPLLNQTNAVTVRTYLNISASRVDHGESYSCAARLNTTELIPDTRSDAVQLEVYYKPRMTFSSPNVTVSLTEGDPLELNCTADANPGPNYQWRHNNKTLDNETRSTLLIDSTEMHHGGSYECIASNSQGDHSLTITVDVLRNYLPVIAILVAIAITIAVSLLLIAFCSYHKKNKTGAYFLTKFKAGSSQNGQVAQANGYP